MSDSQRPNAPDTPPGSATVVQDDPPVHLMTEAAAVPITGRYELVAEIASGGMGVVWRARDVLLGREVGVKTLLAPPAEGSGLAARFREEARITGRLQHPNIPPVHDLGTLPDGRPFLAMKLIDGRTLDALLKERSDPAHDRGRFVAIFEQIAQGVAFAHSKGVIHRDLKPLNVMVGAFGEVQVMDWGLAKVLAAAATLPATVGASRGGEATREGSVLGTPAYMPREQAVGAIDHIDARSDVFSLGGVLCAILTGAPPYRAADGESAQRLAAAAKLDDALARLAACGAEPDLVAMCERCLSAERDDRPKDAGEVAGAVAAFRAEAERCARKAELDRVRATEGRKRARVQLLLAGAVLLLLAAGGGFAWWRDSQARERRITEARLEGERDTAARNKAEQARDGIARSLELAAHLRKDYKFKQAENALAQAAALVGSAPERAGEVERAGRDLAFVVELDDIRYRKWVYIASGGTGYYNTRIAPPKYRKAFADYGMDVAARPPAEIVAALGGSKIKAEAVAALDDWAAFERDEPLRRRLLAVAAAVDPGEWTDRLRDPKTRDDPAAIAKLAADADPARTSPAALSVLTELMSIHNQDPSRLLTAARTRHPSDFELAFALGLRYTLDKAGRQFGAYEAARALRPDNVSVLLNLGSAHYYRNEMDRAAELYRLAIALDPAHVNAHYDLGTALEKLRDPVGAAASYRRAIALDATDMMAHYNLGGVLYALGDHAAAAAASRRAIALDPNYMSAHYNLSLALKALGDAPGAAAAARRAVALESNFAPAHSILGAALAALGDVDGALAAHRRAVELDPKHVPGHHGIGSALTAKGDVAGALAAYQRAVDLDPKSASAHTNLGIAQKDNRELDAAVASYRRAIELDPKFALAYFNLGNVLQLQRKPQAAVVEYRRAIDINPKYAPAYTSLGNALRRTGDVDGAIAAHRRAIEIDPKYAPAHLNLGNIFMARDDTNAAVAEYRRAIEVEPKSAAAHSGLGGALAESGDVDGAIAAFRQSIELNPRYADSYYGLGLLLGKKGDVSGAMAAYKRTIELNPGYAEAHTNLGFIYFEQKKFAEAIGCARLAIKSQPLLHNPHGLLGMCLQKQDDLAGARAAFTEAARLDKYWTGHLLKLPRVPVAPPPREAKRE